MKEYFVGHKPHKIDAKGRISIPANMRASLGEEFIASRGVGDCLALYPMQEWQKFMKNILDNVPRSKRKKLEFYFSASAEKMSLDGQGRLLLNNELREKVYLKDATEAEVFGTNERIEIWNCDLFKEQLDSISSDEVEGILDDYGI